MKRAFWEKYKSNIELRWSCTALFTIKGDGPTLYMGDSIEVEGWVTIPRY